MPYYDDELPEEYAEMGAVMYWKGRAEKAEAENAALRERVKELEAELEDFRKSYLDSGTYDWEYGATGKVE